MRPPGESLWRRHWRHQRTGPGEYFLRSEEHTSELQSRLHLVCRLLLEKNKTTNIIVSSIKTTENFTKAPSTTKRAMLTIVTPTIPYATRHLSRTHRTLVTYLGIVHRST